MTHKNYFTILGCVTGIISIVHLIRIITLTNIVVDGWTIPMWLSAVAIVIAGYVSYTSFRFAGKE